MSFAEPPPSKKRLVSDDTAEEVQGMLSYSYACHFRWRPHQSEFVQVQAQQYTNYCDKPMHHNIGPRWYTWKKT